MFLALPAGAADRTIYLTFDDGPLTGTSNVLDVLEAEQVPATLLMVGMHAQAIALNKTLVQRAKKMPLVTIGNHSYCHAYNHYQHFYGGTRRGRRRHAAGKRGAGAETGGTRTPAGARRV